MQNGTSKALLGSFITTMLLPGIPLIFYGEEQELYLYDSTAANYLFGYVFLCCTSNLSNS